MLQVFLSEGAIPPVSKGGRGAPCFDPPEGVGRVHVQDVPGVLARKVLDPRNATRIFFPGNFLPLR